MIGKGEDVERSWGERGWRTRSPEQREIEGGQDEGRTTWDRTEEGGKYALTKREIALGPIVVFFRLIELLTVTFCCDHCICCCFYLVDKYGFFSLDSA